MHEHRGRRFSGSLEGVLRSFSCVLAYGRRRRRWCQLALSANRRGRIDPGECFYAPQVSGPKRPIALGAFVIGHSACARCDVAYRLCQPAHSVDAADRGASIGVPGPCAVHAIRRSREPGGDGRDRRRSSSSGRGHAARGAGRLAIHKEIITLSRRNSDVRSLGKKRTMTAECEAHLQALEQALAKHEFTATR